MEALSGHDGAAGGGLVGDRVPVPHSAEGEAQVSQPIFSGLPGLSHHIGNRGVSAHQLLGGVIRLNAQQRQDLAHDLAGHRGHHGAAEHGGAGRAAGGVHGQQHDVLWDRPPGQST